MSIPHTPQRVPPHSYKGRPLYDRQTAGIAAAIIEYCRHSGLFLANNTSILSRCCIHKRSACNYSFNITHRPYV